MRTWWPVLNALDDTYYDMGDQEKAMPCFHEAIQLDPDSMRTRTCSWAWPIEP